MKPRRFRLLVTGSRGWPGEAAWIVHWHLDIAFARALDNGLDFIVVHGDCKSGPNRGGVDRYADEWCGEVGVDPERHPANWREGRAAGFKRNTAMVLTKPDLCIAFIAYKSNGATHCLSEAKLAGIPTHLVRYEAFKQ